MNKLLNNKKKTNKEEKIKRDTQIIFRYYNAIDSSYNIEILLNF